jgi:hypothetical protein
MGNTNSNANAQHSSHRHSRRSESPHRLGGARTQSPAPASSSSSARQSQSPASGSQPPQPHKSLRTKKRSLELPDLAQLSLTPVYASPPTSARASPNGRRGPRTSSPIPIPVTSANARAIPGSERRVRYSTISDVQIDTIAQPTRGRSGQRYEDQEQQRQQQQQQQQQMMYVLQDPRLQGFVPEIVNSTIPIHLRQVDGDATAEATAAPGPGDTSITRNPLAPEIIKEVNTPIRWKGGGKSVYLVRAGDHNWKGRQQMTLEWVAIICIKYTFLTIAHRSSHFTETLIMTGFGSLMCLFSRERTTSSSSSMTNCELLMICPRLWMTTALWPIMSMLSIHIPLLLLRRGLAPPLPLLIPLC